MREHHGVSAIVPTFNRALVLGRALASIAAQSSSPDEVIVVDDGSSDSTRELIEAEFPRVRYVGQENRGVSAARNRGIEVANGEWLAFLDSDDEWRPDKLARQLAALAESGEHRLCHTDEIWLRNGRRVNQGRRHAKVGGRMFRACLPLCAISPSSVVIHRSVFDEVGGFDEELPACEDYDLWLRICAASPVLLVDAPLVVKHGGHPDQLSTTVWGLDRFRIRALEKILDRNVLGREDRRATLETLLEKVALFAAGAAKRGRMDEARDYERRSAKWSAEVVSSRSPRLEDNPPAVSIVTALAAEARPIIRHFGLESAGDRPFRIFRGGEVELIVSGVGAAASARAVEHLAGADGRGRRPRAWLNVGIAGHRDAPRGTARLANRIVERRTGQAWYPPLVFDPPCSGGTVCTVDEVERELESDALYEMEAAGFYAAALRVATSECVQVLKVVSDNRESPPERLTAKAVEGLIEESLGLVEVLRGELTEIVRSLRERVAAPPDLDVFLEGWHFTVTQRRQLERLLRRLAALGRPAAAQTFAGARASRDILAALREGL